MSKSSEGGRRLPLGDLSRALPGLVVLCLLLAIWLGWSGVRQWRDADRSEALQHARDAGVAALESAYRDQIAQLTRRMSTDAVKTALGSGDPAVATEAIRHGWAEVEHVEVMPRDLGQAYADPAAFGYSRLALLEAAQQGQAVVARVVRDGGKAVLGLAVDVPQGVVYARLPLARLTSGFEGVPLPPGTYLALRQGSFNVVQRGSTQLADGAEVMAHAVGKTGLRVAAAEPDSAPGPFGLGALGSSIGAVLAVVLAVLAWLTARGGLKIPALRGGEAVTTGDDEPTLGQALEWDPLPVAARSPPSSPQTGSMSR